MNDESAGDAVVRRTLNAIVADPEAFPRDVSPKVGLYRVFEKCLDGDDLGATSKVDLLYEGLSNITSADRKAILLISVEGFTSSEAAYILGKTSKQVDEAIGRSTRSKSSGEPSRILIVEPNESIASFVKSLSEEMGHDVVGIATTVEEAISLADEHIPDVLVTETRLRSGSVFHLLGALTPISDPEVVIITGDPDDLLYAKNPPAVAALLTKPFSAEVFQATLKEVLAGSIPPSRPAPSAGDDRSRQDLEILSAVPVSFAPAAKITGNVVTFVQSKPRASTSLDHLNILRVDHAEDAGRVALLGHNLGSSFSSRMNKISHLLSQPLTEENMLRVANQAQSLTEFAKAADEEMLPAVAADIKSVILSLQQFSKQFPAWREFLAATEVISKDEPDTRHEVANLAQALQSAPNLLSADVSEALNEASRDMPPDNSRSSSYLAGLVHNIYSALARFVKSRGAGVAESFNKKIDEEVGNALASGVSTALIAASTPLLAMASAVPSQWAFAGPLVAFVRLTQK